MITNMLSNFKGVVPSMEEVQNSIVETTEDSLVYCVENSTFYNSVERKPRGLYPCGLNRVH